MKNKFIGAVATAAAISFAVAPVTSTLAHAKSKTVSCYGVNSCKGKSKCKTANNACKGQNACKGKGVVKLSAKQCAKKHGTTKAESATEETTAPKSE